jgi:flagellar basal-body rod modification protein FlgD
MVDFNDPFANLRIQNEGIEVASPDDQRLGQEDFFALLTTELSNQDPTAPADNNQLIAQVTAFSQADSLEQLNEQFTAFAASISSSQALQASGLVGREVLVEGGNVALPEDGNVTGVAVAGSSVQNLSLIIENSVGEPVRTINLGPQDGGRVDFEWDGLDLNGNRLPEGEYSISARATVGDTRVDLPLAHYRRVESVNLGSSPEGVILNVSGDSSITLSNIIEISE